MGFFALRYTYWGADLGVRKLGVARKLGVDIIYEGGSPGGGGSVGGFVRTFFPILYKEITIRMLLSL